MDISNLHEQHFKAIDQKLDDVSGQLSTMLRINKVHFAKMTDFMEQKFGTAVAISERLIHTAYNNCLSPGALHHEALLEIICYVNEIANNSKMLSFVHEPSDIFLVEASYIYKPEDNTFILVLYIPLFSPYNLMPLYKFIPLLIHFNFSSNVSVTPEVRINNIFADRHSKSYQVISSTDLQSCIKMWETDFCKGPHQDMPRCPVPGQCQEHPTMLQILDRWSTRKDLPYGQQHICGVFPREDQHQPRLSKGEDYFGSTDLFRQNSQDQSQLLHLGHGSCHHGR